MKKLKPILLIVLIFAAGFAAGVLTTRVVVGRAVQRATQQPELLRSGMERALARRLGLDAAQREKVGKILAASQTRLRTLRQQFQPEFASVMRDTQAEISALLTPEQQERFDRYRAERERIWPPR